MWKALGIVMLGFALSGCTGVTVSEYANREPTFDPVGFFNGTLVAEGVVLNRSGKVTRYFTATINARWSETSGTLDEVFEWNDGERQTRVWQFKKVAERHYEGRAGDVVGTADMRYRGNAVNMSYVLAVPMSNGRTINVRMDDWLYQTSDDTLINITEMSKFGIKVGQVVLTMHRQ